MEITNTQVWGFEGALRGMRNPLNSWAKSDSGYCAYNGPDNCSECTYDNYGHASDAEIDTNYIIGENDMRLAKTLIASGNEHCKFLRMIHVQADFDMPRYWWSEADTYHFSTKNSCSTMHKLLNNNEPITSDMFLICPEDQDIADIVIGRLESLRIQYKEIQATTKDNKKMDYLLLRAKRLLMEGFLQMRTWDTDYAEVRSIYHQRCHHRLKEEWCDVWCKWAESLPYADVFIIN